MQSESEGSQSCPTLCDAMDCSPPGSSVHGIFQARLLEWAAISSSRRSSQPRDRTWVSPMQTGALPSEPTHEHVLKWTEFKSIPQETSSSVF